MSLGYWMQYIKSQLSDDIRLSNIHYCTKIHDLAISILCCYDNFAETLINQSIHTVRDTFISADT